MASHVIPAVRHRGRMLSVAARWMGGAVLLVIGLYFYTTVAWRYMHFDATHYGHYWATKWWLVAHLGGGSLALLLGPLQFSGWLRRRYVKAHRWMGRLYLSGVLMASVAAIYMGLRVSQSKAFGVALIYLACAWLLISGMAYVAVMRRQFAAHREWMIRSYTLTFGFVLFRFLLRLNVYGGLGLDAQLVMLVWVAWAIPLLAAEVVMQWRRTMGPAKVQSRA